jgi:hypothetical protein
VSEWMLRKTASAISEVASFIDHQWPGLSARIDAEGCMADARL